MGTLRPNRSNQLLAYGAEILHDNDADEEKKKFNSGGRKPCGGCGKIWHTDKECWTLHPELLPDRFKRNREDGSSHGVSKKRSNAEMYNTHADNESLTAASNSSSRREEISMYSTAVTDREERNSMGWNFGKDKKKG